MRLSKQEAMALAKSEWEPIWSVEEVETKPGAVIRRVEGEMGKHYGKPILQQFKVLLHSGGGTPHWIVILEDGSTLLD